MPEPDGKVRVRLGIPDDRHDELRVLAAKSGVSMAAYCEAVVMEAVRAGRVLKDPEPAKHKKKGG